MSFDAWLNEVARGCSCCPVCWDVPCGGCQQGAPCDAMPCRCDDDDGSDSLDDYYGDDHL